MAIYSKITALYKNLESLLQYVSWDYQDILGPKIIKKNQQVFMHKFACQNVLTFPLYILLTQRITTLWSESIDTFWSGTTETIWHRKSQKKQ